MLLIQILLYLVLSSVAYGMGPQSLLLASLCSQNRICTQEDAKLKDQLQWTCQLELKAHQCQELAEKNPEWAPLIKQCDFTDQCREQSEYFNQKNQACLRGYKNALVDLGTSIKDISLSLAGLIEGSWDEFKKNQRQRSDFLKACENSLLCKRDLIKDDHRYNTLSDNQLNSYSAAFLEVEARSLRSYKSSLQRNKTTPYVPLSERPRDDSQLNTEQIEKLQNLKTLVAGKIKEQYSRYSCYSSLAKEELECYAIATVLDPTLIAGYFTKAGRAAVATGRLIQTEVKISRTQLLSKYLNYSPTTVAQNERWIAQAEKTSRGKTVFVDIENSQLKELNDSLKDKNLVTGLTNFQKELVFEKVDQLQQRNPGLVIEKYSDFKSSRFAFSGKVPEDIESQLRNLFSETNSEFIKKMKASGILDEGLQPDQWFRAGVGQSADQANLAARYSRQVEKNELQVFQNKSLATAIQGKLNQLETQRTRLRSELAETALLDGSTFHPDVFDIVRKGKGNTEKTTSSLKNRFALTSISPSTVTELENYVAAADEFSPGIYIAKREVAHLNGADNGGLSADIIGLGAANLKGTAEAIAGQSDINKVLESTRLAEKIVTKNFKEQKDYFEQVLLRSVDPGKIKSLCSGDDCVGVAIKPLTENEKKNILGGLADSKYSGTYRLAFIPEGVSVVNTRNALATHGESIEKLLRQSLGTTMEPRKLKGLTFGVDMQTQVLNQGRLKLILGEARDLNLSPNERKLIQDKFREAIEHFNKNSKGSQYHAH